MAHVFIESHEFVPYNKVKTPEEKVVVYVSIFDKIDDILKFLEKVPDPFFCWSESLAGLTGKYFTQENRGGTKAVILLTDLIIEEIPVKKGSLVIIGGKVPVEKRKIPGQHIVLYEADFLRYVNKTVETRMIYAEAVGKKFLDGFMYCSPDGKFEEKKLAKLGNGSFGIVFTDNSSSLEYAIKVSRPDDTKWKSTPYNSGEQVWIEIFLLKDVLKPLILKKVCPNFPILMSFIQCTKDEVNSVASVVELATNNLTEFLKNTPTNETLLMNCLFQVMAAIHAMQYHAQIMNFDVKKENVLYYKIQPGGYYEYKIMGEKYYIPNLGYLFVLNDFGLAKTMTPKYPMYKNKDVKFFRLGHRLAYIKENELIPINCKHGLSKAGERDKTLEVKWDDGTTSQGSEFLMDRQSGRIIPVDIDVTPEMESFFKQKNMSINSRTKKFFEHPDILPPMEFYNDTQDGIRMFTGHKRTTQKGRHNKLDLDRNFIDKIKEYVYEEGENMKSFVFPKKCSFCFAGHFIKEFFGKYPIFSKPPENSYLIEKYTIS